MNSAAPKDEAKRALTARGFGTFRNWKRENRAAASEFRQRKRKPGEDSNRLEDLARCLDAEYTRLIAPNL